MAEIFRISLRSVLLATAAEQVFAAGYWCISTLGSKPERFKIHTPIEKEAKGLATAGGIHEAPSLSGAMFGHGCPKPLKDGVREGVTDKHISVHSGPGSQFPVRCLNKVSYSNQLTNCLLKKASAWRRHLLPISCTLDLNMGPDLIQNLMLSAASCITPNST